MTTMPSLPQLYERVAYLLAQGGWVLLLLFLMGQAGWYLAVERWWRYRRVPVPRAGALPRGPFASLAAELEAARPHGEEAMVRRAREFLDAFGHGLHRHLGTIAALTAAAPMLGLAGTVGGVMKTFDVITLYGAGNPSMMAGGIAHALMVTEAALVVAVPLMIAHDRLGARADALEEECAAWAAARIRGVPGGAA